MGLAPRGGPEQDAPRTGRHRLGDERVPAGAPRLSYADPAVAVLDEIGAPSRHRTRVSVFVPGAVRRTQEMRREALGGRE
jgi:hypothetical protein